MRKTFAILFLLLVPVGILNFLSAPYANSWAILISIASLWFTGLLPLPITALLVPVLAILFDLLPIEQAFLQFGHEILFLFIGSFFLAKALQKYDIDRRVSFLFLLFLAKKGSVNSLFWGISTLSWFLSMWISNTASTAILAPFCLGIASALKSTKSEHNDQNLNTRFLLTCAFSASMGGMVTPIGSPPNLIAMQFLNSNGYDISFIDWIFYALPASVLIVIPVNLFLSFIFPIKNYSLRTVQEYIRQEYTKIGCISRNDKWVLLVFCIAIFLWIFPAASRYIAPDLSIYLTKHFPMGLVAILAASLLFILPRQTKTSALKKEPLVTKANSPRLLSWEDVISIDWGTVLIFGGGLTLGTALSQSGLTEYIGANLLLTSQNSWALLAIMMIILAILTSEFSSNTASASILIPILLGIPHTAEQAALIAPLVIATTLAASCGFMLPVSTPPNAIVYGTGKIRIQDMIRAGLATDIFAAISIFLLFILFWL